MQPSAVGGQISLFYFECPSYGEADATHSLNQTLEKATFIETQEKSLLWDFLLI